MAEKEDYIVISRKDFDYKKGHYVTHLAKQISRTEAINRTAKAVCMRDMYGCERCVFGKDKEKCEEWIAFNHIRDAEAALNALLNNEK